LREARIRQGNAGSGQPRLTPQDEDLLRIQDVGVNTGILEKRVPMSALIDLRFIPAVIRPAPIDVGESAAEDRVTSSP
jgi:hypothetical protein